MAPTRSSTTGGPSASARLAGVRLIARTTTTTAASSDTRTGRITSALITTAASSPKYSAASPTPTARIVRASARSRPLDRRLRRAPAAGAVARICS